MAAHEDSDSSTSQEDLIPEPVQSYGEDPRLSLLLDLITKSSAPKPDPVRKLIPNIPIFDPSTKSIFDHLEELDWILRPSALPEKSWVECLIQSLRNCPERFELAKILPQLSLQQAREHLVEKFNPLDSVSNWKPSF